MFKKMGLQGIEPKNKQKNEPYTYSTIVYNFTQIKQGHKALVLLLKTVTNNLWRYQR